MRIDRIGFGYVKNLGNYENCKVWLEAELEDWEDPLESLNLLRNKVAEEISLPDKWLNLKDKFNQQFQVLEQLNTDTEKAQEKLKEAQKAWGEYQNFLITHGVNPNTLTIDSPYLSQATITAHKLDAATPELPHLNEGAADDDGYFDPYYGDEYDRLHNQDDEPENSYL